MCEQRKMVLTFKKDLLLTMTEKAIHNIMKEAEEFRNKTILNFMCQPRSKTKWMFFREIDPSEMWDRSRAEQEYDNYKCKLDYYGYQIVPDWLDMKIAIKDRLKEKLLLYNAILNSCSEEINCTIDEFKSLRAWSGMCMDKPDAEITQEEVKS